MSKIPSYRRHKPSGNAVVTLYGKGLDLGKCGTKNSRDADVTLISEYLTGNGEVVPPELFLAKQFRKGLTVVALHIRPDFAMSHNNLGNALLQTARYQEAVAHLEYAAKLKPEIGATHHRLAAA